MVKGHPAMKHTCLITFTAKAPFIKGTLAVTAEILDISPDVIYTKPFQFCFWQKRKLLLQCSKLIFSLKSAPLLESFKTGFSKSCCKVVYSFCATESDTTSTVKPLFKTPRFMRNPSESEIWGPKLKAERQAAF